MNINKRWQLLFNNKLVMFLLRTRSINAVEKRAAIQFPLNNLYFSYVLCLAMSLLSIETSANFDILNQVANQNVCKIIYKHQYANVSYEICTYVYATPMYKHMQTKCIRISVTQCMFIENTLSTGESRPPLSLYHYKY